MKPTDEGTWTKRITNAEATEAARKYAKDANAIGAYWRFVGDELHQFNAEVRAREAAAA